MQLHDAQGKRLYLTAEERLAFMAAAARAARPVRTLCAVLHTTGCRISEALALTPEHVDLPGKAVVFETLKKRRRGVYRAVPVPPGLLDQLDLVHGLREALKRGRGHAERPRVAMQPDDRLAPGHRRDASRRHPGRAAPLAQRAAGRSRQLPGMNQLRQNDLWPSCQASAALSPISLSEWSLSPKRARRS